MDKEKKYIIDYKRLVVMLLPTFLRKNIVIGFLNSMIFPLFSLKTAFDNCRQSVNYRLYHNGQVCYLRAVVNDFFDPADRRITITDYAGSVSSTIIHLREEDNFKIIPERPNAMIINHRGFSGISNYDFVVNVPVSLSSQNDRIIAVVNIYKLVSKRFLINYF